MKYNYGSNIFHTHDRTFTPDPNDLCSPSHDVVYHDRISFLLHQGHQPRAEQLGRRKVALAIDDGEVAVERAVRLHRGGDHLGQRRAERPQLGVIVQGHIARAKQDLSGACILIQLEPRVSRESMRAPVKRPSVAIRRPLAVISGH